MYTLKSSGEARDLTFQEWGKPTYFAAAAQNVADQWDDPGFRKWFAEWTAKEPHDFVTPLAVAADVLRSGVRRFWPSGPQCEALAHVALDHVSLSDYRQPFPCCVVEFPRSAGFGSFVVTTQEAGNLSVYVLRENHDPTPSTYIRLIGGVSFETQVNGLTNTPPPELRPALNYLMLAANCDRLDETTPPAPAYLKERIKRAEKKRDKETVKRLKAELKQRAAAVGTTYALPQSVVFRRTAPRDTTSTGTSGRTIRTHWRRGHWHWNSTRSRLNFWPPILCGGLAA